MSVNVNRCSSTGSLPIIVHTGSHPKLAGNRSAPGMVDRAKSWSRSPGALTLLTNVVMAWNTAQMQRLAEALWGGRPPAALARIAPVAFAHINLRGMFNFSLGALHHHLIESLAEPRMRRV